MPDKKSGVSWAILIVLLVLCVYFVRRNFYSPKLSLELQGKIEPENNLRLRAQLNNVSATKLRKVSLFCSLKVDLPNLRQDVTPKWTPPAGDPIVWADNLEAFVRKQSKPTVRERSPETFWTTESFASGSSVTVPCVPGVSVDPQQGGRIQVFTILTYSSNGIGSFEKTEKILFEGFPNSQGEINWSARDWETFRTSIFVTD
jgi:hypothetical protein